MFSNVGHAAALAVGQQGVAALQHQARVDFSRRSWACSRRCVKLLQVRCRV